MIAKGTTHNNGPKLARYLTTGKEGERAELWQLSGFAANDIQDAFRSVHVMAEATRCQQPFFHVQVRNREGEKLHRNQWLRVADRIETKLGLTDQPRAIAFHLDLDTGHEHMHIAFSRIDGETMTAKPLPFFKERLKAACRELEKTLNLTRVTNERDGKVMAPKRNEFEQARRLGVNIRDARQTIRDCFDRSDCGRSFQSALVQAAMTLACGNRRDFLVVDHAGGIHALGKRILGISAAELRHRLADLDHNSLPTVEQVRAILNRTQEPVAVGKECWPVASDSPVAARPATTEFTINFAPPINGTTPYDEPELGKEAGSSSPALPMPDLEEIAGLATGTTAPPHTVTSSSPGAEPIQEVAPARCEGDPDLGPQEVINQATEPLRTSELLALPETKPTSAVTGAEIVGEAVKTETRAGGIADSIRSLFRVVMTAITRSGPVPQRSKSKRKEDVVGVFRTMGRSLFRRLGRFPILRGFAPDCDAFTWLQIWGHHDAQSFDYHQETTAKPASDFAPRP